MNSMLVKLATNFPKDGQRIAVIGANKILKLTVTRTRWPCRGTIQRTTALQTSHLCMKHTPLLLSNNQVVTLWISSIKYVLSTMGVSKESISKF